MLLARLRSLVDALVRRRRFEGALSDEMRFHLESCAADLMRRGLSHDEAMRRARLAFGNVERVKEEARGSFGLRAFDELQADVRFAWRLLRRAPLFSMVAVLSLALGIGANAAIVSLMQGVLWNTLPVRAPGELRVLSWTSGPRIVMNSSWGNMQPTATGGQTSTSFSYAAFDELRRRESPARIFAVKPVGRVTVTVDDQAELVRAHLVSGEFYDGLGVTPIIGRALTPADDEAGAQNVVGLVSDGFWARRFGRDPTILGRTMRVNDAVVTIVGVNPPEFPGLEPGHVSDLFLPLRQQPVVAPARYGPSQSLLANPDYWWLQVMARVPSDANERQLETSLDATLQQTVRATLPDRADRDQPHLRLGAGHRGFDDLRTEFGRPLHVLLGFVGLVLLITCANLANLLIARSTLRQREISLRLSLGASRGRIARQLLTEGLLVALLGGSTGVVVGYWTRDAIPHLLGTSWRPSPLGADFNLNVLVATLAVTMLMGLVFSLMPAWQAARVQLTTTLKDGGRALTGSSKRMVARALIVAQVTLSVVLLTGAALFVQHLWTLRAVDLGFQPDRVLLFNLDPPRTRVGLEERQRLFDRVQQQITSLPGVQSATLSSWALIGSIEAGTTVRGAGRTPQTIAKATVNDVGDRFFETMGIGLLQGRAIGAEDRANSLRVAVVNRQFVQRFFPGGQALGQTFENGERTYHIVGICADARYRSVSGPVPATFYRSFRQADNLGGVTFEVRTSQDPGAIVRSVREVVRGIDPDLPLFDVRMQTEQIESTLANERLFASLTSSFGLLALLLAAVGIYGIVAHGVATRTSEIGVRIALGAERVQILVMVLRESVALATLGIVFGGLASAGLAKYARALLDGVPSPDVSMIGAAAVLMLAVAILAAWKPARLASRLDPIRALRLD